MFPKCLSSVSWFWCFGLWVSGSVCLIFVICAVLLVCVHVLICGELDHRLVLLLKICALWVCFGDLNNGLILVN
jgi:hypothetical protein